MGRKAACELMKTAPIVLCGGWRNPGGPLQLLPITHLYGPWPCTQGYPWSPGERRKAIGVAQALQPPLGMVKMTLAWRSAISHAGKNSWLPEEEEFLNELEALKLTSPHPDPHPWAGWYWEKPEDPFKCLPSTHLNGPLGVHSEIALESRRKERKDCWDDLRPTGLWGLVKRPLA